ncbi:MAG: DUF3800 domain-containing protein [Candidatus Kerfeldbacteria bacterium]|nr:DUF3800 domain-containing protein [Candidatus Kerfeldbacteria bacterium]
MQYIFIDESGDIGPNPDTPGTSRNFLIAAVITQNKKPLEKVVRNTHQRLRKKYRMHHHMLHAAKEEHRTRLYFYEQLTLKELCVASICIDKKSDRKLNANTYITMTGQLITQIIQQLFFNTQEKIVIVLSRRETHAYLNEYVIDSLKKIILHTSEIEIHIKKPQEEKSLQVADMISWALFRKYEYQNYYFYNIIKKKITIEKYFI